MWVGLWRKLSAEELMLLNCGVAEDSWEFLGQQGDQSVNPKGYQSWIFLGRTDAEAKLQYFGHLIQRADSLEKTLMLRKIEAGGKGDDRGWDGWMASPTQWTWVWITSRSWWWTGRPGMLRFMGSQRVGHDWANWTELNPVILKCKFWDWVW